MLYVRQLCLVGAISACVLAVSACSSMGNAVTGPAAEVVIRDEPIGLVPNIRTGEVGWCVIDPRGYLCPYGFVRTPVIVTSWTGGGPLLRRLNLLEHLRATVRVPGGSVAADRLR